MKAFTLAVTWWKVGTYMLWVHNVQYVWGWCVIHISNRKWSLLSVCVCSSFQLSFQHKVGVLYCKAGQSTEEEMYNNESAGPALDEFLDLLGQRVRLKGFTKYRAQLDNKSKIKHTKINIHQVQAYTLPAECRLLEAYVSLILLSIELHHCPV